MSKSNFIVILLFLLIQPLYSIENNDSTCIEFGAKLVGSDLLTFKKWYFEKDMNQKIIESALKSRKKRIKNLIKFESFGTGLFLIGLIGANAIANSNDSENIGQKIGNAFNSGLFIFPFIVFGTVINVAGLVNYLPKSKDERIFYQTYTRDKTVKVSIQLIH